MEIAESFRQLANVRDLTGVNVILKPHEKLLRVLVTDKTVMVLLETYDYKENQRRIKFNRKGKRLITLGRSEKTREEVIVWDADFVPFEYSKFGRVLTGNEDALRRQYERDCYRPGTSRQPLDNYQRVLAGATTDKMERYW